MLRCRFRPTGVLCSLLLLLAAGCAPAGDAPLTADQKATIEEEVGGFMTELDAATTARDEARLRALYEETFTWFEDGAERYRTVDDILGAYVGLPENLVIETAYEDVRVTPLTTGLATVSSSFDSQFGGEMGAGGFGFSGIVTVLLRRHEEGWRIVAGHTSTRRPGR